jgi:hypothetical protein
MSLDIPFALKISKGLNIKKTIKQEELVKELCQLRLKK